MNSLDAEVRILLYEQRQLLEQLVAHMAAMPGEMGASIRIPDYPPPIVNVEAPPPGPAPLNMSDLAAALAPLLNQPAALITTGFESLSSQLQQVVERLGQQRQAAPFLGAGVSHREDLLDIKRGVTDWETRLDYDVRSDTQPVYVGRGPEGLSTADVSWIIEKVTYDGNSRPSRKETKKGAWDNRANLFT